MARSLPIVTVAVTALAAAALLFLPYGFGAYPRQFFADAATGWLPVWVAFALLAAILATTSVAKALRQQRSSDRHL